MEAQQKTKKQLSEEVKALRHQVAELQTLEAAHKQVEEVRQKAHNELELQVQEQAAELLEARTALRDSSLKHEQAQETYESFKKELEFTYEELELVKEELNSAYLEGQINLKALEVINYELRFANQEKQVLNADVYRGAAELKRLNTFLNSVLMNLHAGMVIVDQQLSILTWNRGAERLWGVLAEEVQGQSFLQLDIGLPVAQLSETLRSCLAGEGARQEVMLEATNSRLQAITCRVTCTPLYGAGRENLGAILLMEPIRAS